MKKQNNLLTQFLHYSFLGLFSFVASTLILTISAPSAHSAELTLAWDPNPEQDIAGYKIYYKTESSGPPYNGTGLTEGNSPIDLGNQIEFTLHGLIDDVTYFFVATAYDTEGLESDYSEELIYGTVNHPPVADAGSDQEVDEGETVTLDGSNSTDPDNGIASYLWTQTTGSSVTLSDPTATKPTFVTPPVNVNETTLTFHLTVEDNGGLQSSDEISVTINDNGITGFPDDVVTMTSSTGESIGIKEDSGGNCVSLSAVDPSTITNTTNKSENLIYGLINMEIKTDTVGGTVKLTFYLPTPAPDGYKWFKYGPNKGWYDYSNHAVFNATRDQVTLTLVDGGAGDDDSVANSVIIDPSGLGAASSSSPSPPQPSSAGEVVGGCFIATAAYGSYMEPHVVILREFRDRFLLTDPAGKAFVDLYYAYSPPIADCIAQNEALNAAVRLSLLPLVGISWMSLNIGPLPALILMFVVASGLIGLAGFRRKMRK